MKTRRYLAVAFLAFVFVAGSQAKAEKPIVRIGLTRPDNDVSLSTPLSGVVTSTIYRATIEAGTYNHHPNIARHRGGFFVSWSNHPVDEDEPGQRVLFSYSADGRQWQREAVLFPAIPTHGGRKLVLTANGWLRDGALLFAIADLHDIIGWSDNEGRAIAKQKNDRYYRTAQRSFGRLARQVDENGNLAAPFWLSRIDDAQTICSICRSNPEPAAALNAMLQEPLNRRRWQLMDGNRLGYWVDRYPDQGSDGHYLVEPTTYRAKNNFLVRLLRDLDPSYRLYATTSRDGASWETPVRTDIPDSPSLSAAGQLPDGRRYLIGNPVKNSRDPLAIRLSRDGLRFGEAQILRRGAPPLRRAGLHKGPGFQYPSAIVADSVLWIVYSVNKEDIAVSRVPLPALNDAGTTR